MTRRAQALTLAVVCFVPVRVLAQEAGSSDEGTGDEKPAAAPGQPAATPEVTPPPRAQPQPEYGKPPEKAAAEPPD